jgi:hypothetical protein
MTVAQDAVESKAVDDCPPHGIDFVTLGMFIIGKAKMSMSTETSFSYTALVTAR